MDADWSRKALYRGLAPSLIRAVPAAAATFLGFEATKGELPIPAHVRQYGKADYAQSTSSSTTSYDTQACIDASSYMCSMCTLGAVITPG